MVFEETLDNSRMPPQLEKNHVAPPSSQDEALGRYSLSREVPRSILGQEDPLEEEMTTHPSILAWRIPWTGEPGGLPSMGSHRVGHD